MSFGAPAVNTGAAPTPFSFGSTQVSSATPSFGFGTTSTAQPSLGFGTQTSTANTSFGFGSQSQPTFGTAAPSSTGGFFSGGLGSFGGASTSSGTGAFGLGSNTFANTGGTTVGAFGSQQQTQAAAPAQQGSTPVESVLSSVLYCNIYGDERDAILARWNLLQAAWGTGKGNTKVIIMIYLQ